MPKIAKELSAIRVARLTRPGLYAVGVVPGLHLQVLPSGARSWVLRVQIGSRRRDMGLGGYPAVSLAQAREDARAARAKVREGIDPIEERKAAQRALRGRQATPTFRECAQRYMAAKAVEFRNPKHAAQWRSTLATYAYPVIGDLAVDQVELQHVIDVLTRDDLWMTRTETASRLRGRIEAVLGWATVSGYRGGDNPARWKGHLDKALPAPRKIQSRTHFAALPYTDLPDFMAKLRQREGTAARALEFAILTAARSGEVRGATWGEIDLDAGIWTIPGERMKAGKEHRVPLSDAALGVLRAQGPKAPDAIVFPAPKGGALSDMTLTAVLRRMKVDATVHGFRSTFRDWAADQTSFPREVAEQALAHTLQGVEAAYRRSDLFEKRRNLMDAWASYCTPGSAKVTPIKRMAAK